MADYAVPGTLWPEPYTQFYNGHSAFALTGAAYKAAGIFQAPKAGNVRKVSFRTGIVTAGDTVKLSLQGLDASGDPDGTILGTGNTAYGTLALVTTTDNYKHKQVTLSADLAVTLGQELAAVVEFNSYVAGNLQIAYGTVAGTAAGGYSFPYVDGYATSWTKNLRGPLFSLEYDDGSYAHTPACSPTSTAGSLNAHFQALDADNDPDEYGITFQLPFDCRLVGFWAGLTTVAGADFEVNLYGPETLLYTGSAAKSYIGSGLVIVRRLTEAIDLTADTWYRLTLHATTGTALNLWYLDTVSAAAMDALAMGQKCYATKKSDAGDWTDTTTRRYQMGLLIDQETVETAGGGTGRPEFREGNL